MPSRIQSYQTQLKADSTFIILGKRGHIHRGQRDREVAIQIEAPPGGLIAGAEADVADRPITAMVRREAEAIARMPATSSTKSGPILGTTG